MSDPTDPRDGDRMPPTEPFTPPADDAASQRNVEPIVVAPTEGPQPSAAGRARAGILGSIRTHPAAWITSGAVAAFLIIGGGSFAAGAATAQPTATARPAAASSATHMAAATPAVSPTATASATPTQRPTANPAAPASALKTCSVSTEAADARLGTLEAQVINAKTGDVLFDRNSAKPAPTASVLKTVTGAAALAALGSDTTIATTVVKGSQPGQVVIVGGGDPTLTAGNGSWFQGAPSLKDLASQVQQAWAADASNAGQPITSVVADASLFGGEMWQSSWDENEERVVQGSTAYIAALMVDGDKQDPTKLESPRGTDPVGDAGAAFAADLGVSYAGAGTAPTGAQQLGVVHSQPVSALVNEALENSDNTVMEMLARLTAVKEGAGNTFGAIQAGDTAALKTYGLDVSGLTIVDGSGLSANNAVPASFIASFMVKVLNRESGLGLIYDALPIAGQTGTLAASYGRFTGASAVAAGHVHAKTGWIVGGYTLAGTIDAKDGTPFAFAIFALGNVGDSAKAAIDALTAAIYTCGGNLSNS